MKSKVIYLDYAAATPISDASLKLALKLAHDHYYNPQALYKGAKLVGDLIYSYKARMSKLLEVKSSSLFIVNSATQTNLGLIEIIRKTYPNSKIACLNIDHDSFKDSADLLLSVDSQTARLKESQILNLKDNVCLLSIAGINNELGIIQDFKMIKGGIKKLKQDRLNRNIKTPILLHIDASQMGLIYSLKPQALAEADFITYNGSKIYAFRGSGLFYVKNPSNFNFESKDIYPPLINIASLTLSLELVSTKRVSQFNRLQNLQIYFQTELEKLGAEIVFKTVKYKSPHITTVLFNGVDNENLIFQLSQENIYVGTGSACHSHTDLYKTSALRHLNYSKDQIYSSLRFSFGYETTKSQLKLVIKKLEKILKK